MSNNKDMDPISGEKIEVDGVYQDEWGGEREFKRGDRFPHDPALGNTEWNQIELSFDNHHEGKTDPRLVPKENDVDKMGKITNPRTQRNARP